MTNNGKKIACVALASALCLGVGFSPVLGPISASASSLDAYGNSSISGLGIQPTMSAIFFERGGDPTDPEALYQYRTNLDGYVEESRDYYYHDVLDTFEATADIKNSAVYKSMELFYHDDDYQNYQFTSVSFSSCMPSSPRFLHFWQWDCWRSFQPRVDLWVDDEVYLPTVNEVEGEFTLYAYVRGDNTESNTPYLQSYSYPCTVKILGGKAAFTNPLPSLADLVTTHPEVLYVPHEDGGIAGIMASIAFNFGTNLDGVNHIAVSDTALNNVYMSYGSYQEYEVAYMERFAVLNNVTRYDIDPLSSMWNVVDGFFSTELFDGFKIGDLLAIAVGSLLLGLFLKIFLGG